MPHRVDAGVRNDLCSLKSFWCHVNHVARDWSPTSEDIGRNGGGGNGTVRVVNIVDVFHVDYLCDVSHFSHVRNVDYAQVITAVVIPWEKWLAWPEGEPRSQPNADPDPYSHTNGKAGASDESNERGGVNGKGNDGAGNPTPSHANMDPAAIVEWAEAPRFVLHPGPTPRPDPHPSPEAIRNPVYGNTCGIPDRSVVGDLLPRPVIVQLLVAGHVAAYVA